METGLRDGARESLRRRVGRPLAAAADRVRAWAAAWLEETGRHPARLVWTLLLTAAYVAAARPLWADGRALWAHFQSFFLVNMQQDYGEGPLFNQEVLLYHGQDIYRLVNTPPFAFGNYPPVFPLVASLLMRVHRIGVTFLAGRLTSSLAIMGSGLVAALIVLQATRQLVAAFIGGALLYTFSAIFDWGPYNRVDSLALFWSLCTLLLALRYAGTRRAWWVLPFAVLTIYTRQSSVDAVAAAFVYLLVRDWRRGLAIGLACAAALLAVFAGLQLWSHGAFYLNTVVFNENAWNWGTVTSNWSSWMRSGGGRFVFRLALAGAALGLLRRGGVVWPVWLAAASALFVTIGKTGAAENYFFPVEAAAAVCVGVCIGQFRTLFRRAPFPLWPLELVLPAMLFLYIHGSPAAWAARVPLLPRLETAVGTWTVERSEVAGQARGDLALRERNAKLRAADRPVARPKLETPGNVQQLGRFYAGIQGPVMALDFPRAEVVQGGHQMQWQPFELGVAYDDGHWTPAPLLAAIGDRYYAAIVFQSFGGFLGYDGDFGSGIVAAIQASYHDASSIQGFQVWQPDGPPLAPAPPVTPIAVPQPLPDLVHALASAVMGLPAALVRRTERPVLETVGAFTEVQLAPLFNGPVTAEPGVPGGPGFDGGGNAFAETLFPRPGTLQVQAGGLTVPFFVPSAPPGKAAAIDLDAAVSVRLPVQVDGAVWLLEAGVDGAQQVPVSLQFASGPARHTAVTFSDWCVPGGPPEYAAYTAPNRLSGSGATDQHACGLFALRIPAASAQALQGIVLGPAANGRVLAVTLQRP